MLIAICALVSACAPRQVLLPALNITPPVLADFGPGFEPPISAETNKPMSGFGGNGGGVNRTPVIFVHGNTVSARYWLPAREHFKKAGYTDDELWALGYGWDNTRYFDSNDLSVQSLDRIVTSVTAYLSKKSGRNIQQVDIIAHSMGVTLVRQWMLQTNSFHKVRNFVAACGASDGVWTAWPDSRGQQRPVSFELYPQSPWLQQLNRVGETPGPTRYMTLYDGTGWADVLFPPPSEHSGALEGAFNLAYNLENGTWFDHLALPREAETMDAMLSWMANAREPLPQAQPPQISRIGNRLKANQTEAKLYCRVDGLLPSTVRDTPFQFIGLEGNAVHTCFAHNPLSGLSSAMARFQHSADLARSMADRKDDSKPKFSIESGAYEHPQNVEIKSAGDGVIVYTTSGTPPNSGSPRYTQPIFIAAPLTLKAAIIYPDGSQSKTAELELDISLELIEARHTLQRNFEADAPVKYEGKRVMGR